MLKRINVTPNSKMEFEESMNAIAQELIELTVPLGISKTNPDSAVYNTLQTRINMWQNLQNEIIEYYASTVEELMNTI